MITVDARGLSCPLPVMRTDDVVRRSSPDEIEVLVDSGTAKANVAGYLRDGGYEVGVEQQAGGEYTVRGTR